MTITTPAVKELEERFILQRSIRGKFAILVSATAILFSLFQFYSTIFPGQIYLLSRYTIFLGFTFFLGYLLYPLRKKDKNKIPIYDYIFLTLSVISTGYFTLNGISIIDRIGNLNNIDILMGFLIIVLLLELTRRTIGLPLVIISIAFLLYAYFGNYLPPPLGHKGFSFYRIVEHVAVTWEGIMGIPMLVVVYYIFLFVLLSAFMERSGVTRFFIDLALKAFGRTVGGPAKVGVVGSALFGTISGSSIANVLAIGAFTIPLMKRYGYKPEMAGAIEPCASVGGMIMPPMMAATAFVIAEFLGISYARVALAAFLPAVIYFLSIFISVDLNARKEGLKGLKEEELKTLISDQRVFRRSFLLLPLISLIIVLALGYTPVLAALVAIAMTVVVGIASGNMKPKDILTALEIGARNSITITAAVACAGIIIGVFTLTGLALNLSGMIINLVRGNLIPLLLLTMIVCLIIGMGVPTTPNYIMTATIAAPALIKMGILPLAAHMFVFYYGILADLTPPVALAAYVGAIMAQSDFWKTSINAVKIALPAFIAPLIFVYEPTFLFENLYSLAQVGHLVFVLISVAVGVLALGASTTGYLLRHLNMVERAAFLVVAGLLIFPEVLTTMVGFGIFAVLVIYIRSKRGGS